MATRTMFLSRLIGLFLILAALSLAAHVQLTLESLTALIQNPALLLIAGLVFLATGLALVLAHNVWSGGAQPILITLIGWITLIRGLLLLLLSRDALLGLLGTVFYGQLFYLYVFISLVLGAYLTYCGFRTRGATY